MNKTKIIGVVLALHGLIIGLLLLPGCKNRMDPPGSADTAAAGSMGDGNAMATSDSGALNPELDRSSSTAIEQPTASSSLQPPRRPVSMQFATNEPPAPEPVTSLPESSFNDNLAPEPAGISSASGPSVLDMPGGSVPADAGSSTFSYIVQSGDSLWKIAKANNVSLKALLDANGLTKKSVIKPGQRLAVPGFAPTTGTASTTTAVLPESTATTSFTTYTVQKGDTLSGIAYRNGTTVAAIRSLNSLSSDVIRIGQQLKLADSGVYQSPKTLAPTTVRTAEIVGGNGYHTVIAGESPSLIAAKYGMKTNELMRLNSISDPRKLRVGQRLIVSGAALEAAKQDFSDKPLEVRQPANTAPVVLDEDAYEPEPLSFDSAPVENTEEADEPASVGDPLEELYEPEDSEIPVLQF